MGLSSGALLRNKVNLNRTPDNRNVLSLAEAVRMTDLTGDKRIVEAWARQLGMILIEMPTPENCADADVIELMAQTWETNGDIGREVNATFADGRVEQDEVRRVRDRVWTHIRMLFGLVGRIEGMAEK
jgi:prepilin-type processing-associated H-X9-DG protein